MAKTLNQVYEKIVNRIENAMEKTCLEEGQEIIKEASRRATLDPFEVRYSSYDGYPNMQQFITYQSSFKVGELKKSKDSVSIRAFNDYKVYFKKLGVDIPYGYFLEYGTGRNASGQYDYTNEPWDERTVQQGLDTGGKFFYINDKPVLVGGTFGMSAEPHWTPTIYKARAGIKAKLEANFKHE